MLLHVLPCHRNHRLKTVFTLPAKQFFLWGSPCHWLYMVPLLVSRKRWNTDRYLDCPALLQNGLGIYLPRTAKRRSGRKRLRIRLLSFSIGKGSIRTLELEKVFRRQFNPGLFGEDSPFHF